MNLSGHSDQKYATGTRLSSSAERDWSSILVERWRHKKGRLNDIKPRETEIAVLLAGSMHVRRRGDGKVQECLAVPGTIWLCPAGIQERDIEIFGDPEGEMEEVVHIFLPAEPFSEASLKEFDIDPARARLGYLGGFQDGFVAQVGKAISREMNSPSSAGALMVDTLRASLAAYLLRQYSSLSPRETELPSANGALDKRRLSRVKDFIEANIERNMKLEELAKIACLSPYHFARAFKASTGVAPHQYMMNQKLDLAKALLSDDNYKLIEVAFKSGFANQAHFTRAFKRATGTTPGEFRKNTAARS